MSYQKKHFPSHAARYQGAACEHYMLKFIWQVFIICLCITPLKSFSQKPTPIFTPSEIKKLSVEELMNIEITSVSKLPEKLTEVASAIQVINSEDIRRSTATRLPDALRLAPNLQVARVSAHDWAISARGFNGYPLGNNTLADKLLVMIDGRTVYEPIFGGVNWDIQNVLLEDVNRIEVVSGPGGTLWGANAVNGVINIISKSAAETQGLYASGSYGSFLREFGALRYGSHIDSTLFFRVYGQYFGHKGSKLGSSPINIDDKWDMLQGGFRIDYLLSSATNLTLQGDLYNGKLDSPQTTYSDGQNILGRLSHTFSKNSDITLQVYYDRTWRNTRFATPFKSLINTYDAELQHHWTLNSRNRILWGAGYRILDNETNRGFDPANRTLELFNGFIQDQISLIPKHLELTVGTKLLHNDYSDFEWQPSARLAWLPDTKHTIWAAVSRAVRTPARFDADLTILSEFGELFKSEKVISYEIGYRIRPIEKMTFSLAGYYNDYSDLRSINNNPSAPPARIFANNQEAKTWGFEVSGNAIISNWWRARGGYTFLHKKFNATSANVIPGSNLLEALDPKHQVMLQSIIDLPKGFQFDCVTRYVDQIPLNLTENVPSYYLLDARIAWQYRFFTLAVNGQNLLENSNAEFGRRKIPRSVYGNLTIRF